MCKALNWLTGVPALLASEPELTWPHRVLCNWTQWLSEVQKKETGPGFKC